MAMKRVAVRALREVSRVSIHPAAFGLALNHCNSRLPSGTTTHFHPPPPPPPHHMRLQARPSPPSPPALRFPPSRGAIPLGLRRRPRRACLRAGFLPLRRRLTTVRGHPPAAAAAASSARQGARTLTLEDVMPPSVYCMRPHSRPPPLTPSPPLVPAATGPGNGFARHAPSDVDAACERDGARRSKPPDDPT